MNVTGNQSQMVEAISGVSQGSDIGPILFVIYVNDLPNNLSADSLLYADDVKPKASTFPLVTPPISSLTPSRPKTHPTPRKSQKLPPPKTWELSYTPGSVLKIMSLALPIKPVGCFLHETILHDLYSHIFPPCTNFYQATFGICYSSIPSHPAP